MNNAITIGNRSIGTDNPVYIVAEIGINHNGDMNLAKMIIDAAREAGADSVKFQNYRTEDFVPTASVTHTYISQGHTVTESQYEMFKRYELSDEQVIDLSEYCRKVGIDFHSTPTNSDGVALLQKLGVGVLKNGSDYLSNLPLIESMARTGLPTVLSTGMATEKDIEEAISAFSMAGGRDVILLHCVSQYPAPLEELNLRRIPALSKKFNCPVGFSDHTNGMLAACLAVSLGACWIEKHFTLDKSLPGPDHAFSSDPNEFAELIRRVRDSESALGVANLDMHSERENQSGLSFRLSCAAASDLPGGTVLREEDIAFFRPGDGLPPKHRNQLVGRQLVCDVKRGQIFNEAMFK